MWPRASITTCYSNPAQNAPLLISPCFLITDFLWHFMPPSQGPASTVCLMAGVKGAVNLTLSKHRQLKLLCWPRAPVVRCPPGQGLFCATSSPWQSFSGRNGATKNCPSSMPSLTVQCLYQKSESSCHIALIKWAKDCYHRVMGSCWSINVGAKLEAFMETMWKAWYLFSEQGSAGPFS